MSRSRTCFSPCRPTVLPDDRRRDWLERSAIPHHERLALVGDAHRTDIARACARRIERALCAHLDRRPDLVRVVLHPSRTRVVLGDLLVTLAANLAIESDGDGSRAGGALVEA